GKEELPARIDRLADAAVGARLGGEDGPARGALELGLARQADERLVGRGARDPVRVGERLVERDPRHGPLGPREAIGALAALGARVLARPGERGEDAAERVACLVARIGDAPAIEELERRALA